MKRIRILFTIPNFLTAGSGREMVNIIELLDKRLFDPFIAVQQAGGKLYDELIAKGYPVIVEQFCVHEADGVLNKMLSAKRLGKKFKPYQFNVWQSFNWSSDFTEALVAKFSGARYVYVKKNMNWDRRAWKIKSYLADAIIARNTTLIDKYFSARVLKRKSFLISGGVRNSVNYLSSNVRDKWNIPANATLVSCVAQIVKVKDQATLINAVAGIDNVYVILAGAERDMGYAGSLRKLIADSNLQDRVLMIGNIENVAELLQTTDIFVLPTTNKHGHEEGCPVALLEAMSVGVPCIASNVAGNRDLVLHGRTGLLFTPGNACDLMDCIRAYIDDPLLAAKLAKNARQKVEEEHTLEIEAESFSNVYKKLVGIK